MKKLLLILLFVSPLIAMEKKSSKSEYQKQKLALKEKKTNASLALQERQVKALEELVATKKAALHLKQLRYIASNVADLPSEAPAYVSMANKELLALKLSTLSNDQWLTIQEKLKTNYNSPNNQNHAVDIPWSEE